MTGDFSLAVYLDSVELGGAEESLATLLGHLSPGIRVTVLGVDRRVVSHVAARRPGTGSLVLRPVRGKADLASMALHVAVVRSVGADLLQANMRHPWSSQYGMLAGVLNSVPVVAVVHGEWPASSAAQRWRFARLYRRCAAIVGVSDWQARRLEDLVGLDREDARTIYNGVPDCPAGPHREGPSLQRAPTIAALGRLSHEKGFDLALRALQDLAGVRMVLAGDGPERPRLERLAESLGVADRVTMLGYRSDPRSLLASADLVVVPSRSEAFGMVIVEAMLARVPVVATRVGGIPEVVLEGETGILVEPENPGALSAAAASLLSDRSRRRAFGERAREVALERFSAEGMASGYERLYADILGARPAPLSTRVKENHTTAG